MFPGVRACSRGQSPFPGSEPLRGQSMFQGSEHVPAGSEPFPAGVRACSRGGQSMFPRGSEPLSGSEHVPAGSEPLPGVRACSRGVRACFRAQSMFPRGSEHVSGVRAPFHFFCFTLKYTRIKFHQFKERSDRKIYAPYY